MMFGLTEIIAGIVGLIALAIGAVGGQMFGRMRGKREGRKDADNDASKDYMNKRKEIDNADLGIGATDAERIKRLHNIADRQRGGGS